MPTIRVKKEQLSQLKAEYAKIEKIDPSSPKYKKILELLDQLPQGDLKLLAGADIKWISPLAKNRLKKESVDAKTIPNLFETPLPDGETYLVSEAIDKTSQISNLYVNVWIGILNLIPPLLHKNINEISRPARKGISDIAMIDIHGYTQSDMEFSATISMTSGKQSAPNTIMAIVMTKSPNGENSRVYEFHVYRTTPKDVSTAIAYHINQSAGYSRS